MCSPELWQIQAIHEEKEALGLIPQLDDEEEYRPDKIKKKNAPVINVKRKQ